MKSYIIKNIKRVSGKEYEYFYLRKAERIKSEIVGEYPKKQTILYSFGNKKKALLKLNDWENDIRLLPNYLSSMGYTVKDVKKWIEQIENK